MVNTPVKVAEFSELNLGGRDMLYIKEENLMFVAMSDMNITSRLDAYLTNVYSNFEIDLLVYISMGETNLVNR